MNKKVEKAIITVAVLFFVFMGGMIYAMKVIGNQQERVVEQIRSKGAVADGKIKLMGVTVQEYIVTKNATTNKTQVKIEDSPYYQFVPFMFGLVITVITSCIGFFVMLFVRKTKFNN